MKVQQTLSLAAGAVAANPSRPATVVVHDSPDARAVLFRLSPRQAVPVHTSPAMVMMSVLSGSGFVSGAEGEHEVRAGDLVTYARGEPHGMRASDEQLVLMAVIAPRPGLA